MEDGRAHQFQHAKPPRNPTPNEAKDDPTAPQNLVSLDVIPVLSPSDRMKVIRSVAIPPLFLPIPIHLKHLKFYKAP